LLLQQWICLTSLVSGLSTSVGRYAKETVSFSGSLPSNVSNPQWCRYGCAMCWYQFAWLWDVVLPIAFSGTALVYFCWAVWCHVLESCVIGFHSYYFISGIWYNVFCLIHTNNAEQPAAFTLRKEKQAYQHTQYHIIITTVRTWGLILEHGFIV
jgi:hypothetical protein